MRSSVQSSAALGDTWESLWAPYDERSYQAVLASIAPQDSVIEIGAGDLRLSLRIAEIARRVYAIEIQSALLEKACQRAKPGKNLEVIQGDARMIPFPNDITVAVLLMRHCAHFDWYVQKLLAVGCNRLITNARWGSGVEILDLCAPRQRFDDLEIGWYACLCGATGFKIGPVELLKPDIVFSTAEVVDCPGCNTYRNQIKCKEGETLEPIPIFPDLPTEINTLYDEGV